MMVGTPAAFNTTDDAERLTAARHLLAMQQSLASTLGNHFMANTSLELLLELFIARLSAQDLAATDAIARLGPSPNVTWRWIMALEDDGLVALAKDGRNGILALTQRGLERTRDAIDAVAAFG